MKNSTFYGVATLGLCLVIYIIWLNRQRNNLKQQISKFKTYSDQLALENLDLVSTNNKLANQLKQQPFRRL